MLDPKTARKKLLIAIQQEFLRVKREHNGQLGKYAQELGMERQQLQQYANKTIPPADALLMLFMKSGGNIRIEDENARIGEPKWWQFSMSGRDGGFNKPAPKPVQMSLFEAIHDLHEENIEVKILRKSAGRLELGVEIGFKKFKF